MDVTDCGIKGAATLRILHGKYNKKQGTLYMAYLCNSDSEALLFVFVFHYIRVLEKTIRRRVKEKVQAFTKVAES